MVFSSHDLHDSYYMKRRINDKRGRGRESRPNSYVDNKELFRFVARICHAHRKSDYNGRIREKRDEAKRASSPGLMAAQCHPFAKALGQSGPEDGIARVNRSKVIVPPT